jgi:hypothetical protein
MRLGLRLRSLGITGTFMQGLRLLWQLVAILFVLLAPAAGHAQDGEEEYEKTVEEALEQYERGRWDEAAALFRRAHQLNPSARTLRGLGLSLYEARHYPDAMHYLSEALEETRRPLTPKQREEVSATINRAKLFVGNLILKVQPRQAHVTINGQHVEPDENDSVVTEAGWLDIEVTAEGYQPLVRRVRMNAGDRQELAVKLSPEGAVAPTTATVAREAAAPQGAARLEEPASNPRQQEPNSSALGTWKWVATGGAAAALAAGGAMLIMQKVQASDYENECVKALMPQANCNDRKQLLGSTLWTGSIVGLSIGAGLTALSVALFVLDREPGEKEPSLACAPGPGAVACRFTF